MNKRNIWQFLSSAIGRLIILAVVILFLVNIGRSIYKNYQINNQIDSLKAKIASLEEDKIDLENRILYYQTDTYKELGLRRHLGYIKPDEKVVVIYKKNQDSNQQNNDISNSQTEAENQPEDLKNDDISNWQKWWNFIFG